MVAEPTRIGAIIRAEEMRPGECVEIIDEPAAWRGCNHKYVTRDRTFHESKAPRREWGWISDDDTISVGGKLRVVPAWDGATRRLSRKAKDRAEFIGGDVCRLDTGELVLAVGVDELTRGQWEAGRFWDPDALPPSGISEGDRPMWKGMTQSQDRRRGRAILWAPEGKPYVPGKSRMGSADFPHACPLCRGRAYVGFLGVDHAPGVVDCGARGL